MSTLYLVYTNSSPCCKELLQFRNRTQLSLLCVDSKIVRNRCNSWGISYIPSIIEVLNDDNDILVHSGMSECQQLLLQRCPPPQPQPPPPQPQPQPQPQLREKHVYKIAVPKPLPPPKKPEELVDPTQDLLDISAPPSESISSILDLQGGENKTEDVLTKLADISEETDPHVIQQKKIQSFNEKKRRNAIALEKKAKDAASKNLKTDIMTQAKKMQSQRHTLDTDRDRSQPKRPESANATLRRP